MSFLISDAIAATAATPAAGQPDSMVSLLMMGGIFIVFYFLIIRPQSKKAKEHRELVSKVKVGDEVLVAGGILTEVKRLDEQFIVASIQDGTDMIVQRSAVIAVMPKGTLNTIKKA
jgi:preprotein translocase subunit YajC